MHTIQRILSRTSPSHLRAVSTKRALKLVKYTIVFVEITQLPTEMVVDIDRLDWSAIHIHVPDLEAQVVAR